MMDNYVNNNKKEEYTEKNNVYEPKYSIRCICCGRKFITTYPLKDVCDECVDDFTEIVLNSANLKLENDN